MSSEYDKIVKQLEKYQKQTDQSLSELTNLRKKQMKDDSTKPIRSVKPNLFLTGKRASQENFIAARGALATEKYTKAYLSELKSSKIKAKKQVGIDKKEKAKREKIENERHQAILDAQERLLEATEAGLAKNETKEQKEERLRNKALAENRRRERAEKKRLEEERRKNRSWTKRVFEDVLVEGITKKIDNTITAVNELAYTNFKTFEKKEEEMNEHLDRVENLMADLTKKNHKNLTPSERLLMKLFKDSDFNPEKITKEAIDAAMMVDEKINARRNVYFEKFGKMPEQMVKEYIKHLKKIKPGDVEGYKKLIAELGESNLAAQDYIKEVSEAFIDVEERFKELVETGKLSQDNLKDLEDIVKTYTNSKDKFDETKERFSKLIDGLGISFEKVAKEQSKETVKAIKKLEETSEETNEALKDIKEATEDSNKFAEKQAKDAKDEYRDNFIDREQAKAIQERGTQASEETAKNTAEILKLLKDGIKTNANGSIKSPKGESEGGILSTLVGLFGAKYGLNKLKGSRLGKWFSKKFPKLSGGLGKLTSGAMLGGLFGGDITDVLMGDMIDKSGPKQAPTSKPSKKGFFSKILGKGKGFFGGLGKFAKGALKKIPGLGLVTGIASGASRLFKGDFGGALGEFASGALSTIPGLGTVASLGVDGWLMNRDQKMSSRAPVMKSDVSKIPTSGVGSVLSKISKALPIIAGLSYVTDWFSDGKNEKVKELKPEVLRSERASNIPSWMRDTSSHDQGAYKFKKSETVAQFKARLDKLPIKNSGALEKGNYLHIEGSDEVKATDFNTLARERTQLKVLSVLAQIASALGVEKAEEKAERGLERAKKQTQANKIANLKQKEKAKEAEKKSLFEKLKEKAGGMLSSAATSVGNFFKDPIGSIKNAWNGLTGGNTGGSPKGVSVKAFPPHNGGKGVATMTMGKLGREIHYPNGDVKTGGTRNWRNNNPGNLEYNNYTKGLGAIGTDGRFAIFPSMEAGFKAQMHMLTKGKNYKNLTLAQAIQRYAPPSENNTSAYIAQVVKTSGVPAGTIMGQMSEAQAMAVVKAMANHEGAKVGQLIKADGTQVSPSQQINEAKIAQSIKKNGASVGSVGSTGSVGSVSSTGPVGVTNTSASSGNPYSLAATASSTASTPMKTPTAMAGGGANGYGQPAPSGNNAVDAARAMVGRVGYRWGGKNNDMFLDCSGFVQKVIRSTGIAPDFPGSTETQLDWLLNGVQQGTVQPIPSTDQLQGGDIIFFASHSSGRRVGHIAIMSSPTTMIHSSGGSKCKTGNEPGCKGVVEVNAQDYFARRRPNYMFRILAQGHQAQPLNQNAAMSQIAQQMSAPASQYASSSAPSPSYGNSFSSGQNSLSTAGNATTPNGSPVIGSPAGLKGSGMIGNVSMRNNPISSLVNSVFGTTGVGGAIGSVLSSVSRGIFGKGASSMGIGSDIIKNTGVGALNSSIQQGLGALGETLPFNNIMSQMSGAQGMMNRTMMNTPSMIGQGLGQLAQTFESSNNSPAVTPYISDVDDSSLDILRGLLGSK